MFRPIIYPYRMGSESARTLANSLRDLRSKRVRSDRDYVPFSNHLIINWGNPRQPAWSVHPRHRHWLNTPTNVATASNKLQAYQKMEHHVPIPNFTTNLETANEWRESGDTILCRRILNGHGGVGINIITPDMPGLVEAPLYVKYVKKLHEYRVHVFQERVIDGQMKRNRSDDDTTINYQIRNGNNGWIFCRENVDVPQAVLDAAISAISALSLDFGAVDVGWNARYERATVYEVNCAPGLVGVTVDSYSNAIRGVL